MLLRQPRCKVKTDILLTGLAPVQKDIMMLERVQRRATKIILNDYTSNYEQRLIRLNSLPLVIILELNDMLFYFIFIKGY